MTFDLWLRGCEINNTKIFPLEGSGDTAIYKVWSEYECDHNYYRTTPLYFVWIAGNLVLDTMDLSVAYKLFDKHTKL